MCARSRARAPKENGWWPLGVEAAPLDGLEKRPERDGLVRGQVVLDLVLAVEESADGVEREIGEGTFRLGELPVHVRGWVRRCHVVLEEVVPVPVR